jgi:hypothetical protein
MEQWLGGNSERLPLSCISDGSKVENGTWQEKMRPREFAIEEAEG